MTERGAVQVNPIEWFAGYYLQDDLIYKVPRFHREMYDLAYKGHKRIVIAAPRSFAKSTVFSKIYPLYLIYEGVFPKSMGKIVIVSNTAELAEEWLAAIKEELEDNKFLTTDYGEIQKIVWRNDSIVIRQPRTGKKVSIKALGEQKQIRGRRPDVVVCDDLEDDESVESEDQRAKRQRWFDKALINTLEKENQLVVVGTILHPLSLLSTLLEREMYERRFYMAYTTWDKEESIWPEKWPVEALRDREKEVGTIGFNQEFMNTPVITENPIFAREWLLEYDSDGAMFEKEVTSGLYTVVAIDPAISRKETADYTAIVTLSANFDKPEPKIYVRVGGVMRGHWPINKQVAELERIYRKFDASAVVVETVAYQQALADEFRAYCEANRRFPKIIEAKPDRDKERRAHAVASMVERGRVFFDYSDTLTQRLMNEMFMFPTGDRDDLVDAFVYALTEIKEWAKRRAFNMPKGPYVVLPSERRNQWTGTV